jgi:hypothetical protein
LPAIAVLVVATTSNPLSAQATRNCPRQEITVAEWKAGYRRHENLSTKAPQAIFCRLFQPYARYNYLDEPFLSASAPDQENFMRLYTAVGRSSYAEAGSTKIKEDYRRYTAYVAHEYLTRYVEWRIPKANPPKWQVVLTELWELNYGDRRTAPTDAVESRKFYLEDLTLFKALNCKGNGTSFTTQGPWNNWESVFHRYRTLGPPTEPEGTSAREWQVELKDLRSALDACKPHFGPP